MEDLYPGAQENESAFLLDLLMRGLPERVQLAAGERSMVPLLEAASIMIFTGTVGIGYLYGLLRTNIVE
jgi:hypothetical protein